MTWLLIKIAIHIVIFGLVFGFAIWRSENVSIKPKFALPVVAIVFALINAGLYSILSFIIGLATLGLAFLVMPFVLNAVFLLVTTRLLKRLKVEMTIDGIVTIAWLAALLTAAHGALWLTFKVLG